MQPSTQQTSRTSGLLAATSTTARPFVIWFNTGDTYGRRKEPVFQVISVYRDERGLYETAVTYKTA